MNARSLIGAIQDRLAARSRWNVLEIAFWLVALSTVYLLPGRHLILTEIAILGLFALSLDLILGYAGIISLGHAAFFGFGAYVAGLLAVHGIITEPLLALLASGLAAMPLGFVTSFLVLRGSDLTRIMVTLGVALVLREIANRYAGLTGGADGLQGVEVAPLLGLWRFDMFGHTAYAYTLGVLFVMFVLARRIVNSPFGLSLLSIKGNPLRAAAVGIERFVAEVIGDNNAMLRVFEDAGFGVSRALDHGTFEVTFPIEPTASYVKHVDERDHLGVVASLQPFFSPGSVAVIGASTRREAIGGIVFRNILSGDFKGAAYPVNIKGAPVAGVRAYTSIDELPEIVDLAVICLPAARVIEAAQSALRAGIRAICVISAGFAEVGEEGRARQDELLALARAHGGRLVGPNCLGIAVAGPSLNATFGPRPLPPGPIAFSSQSGALGLALLEKASERSLGFSSFISIGNKADVSSNDLLEYWEEDESTGLIVLYLESFGNPRRFGRIASRVARKKPILAMKSGTSTAGARAAGSHTAALAGSEEAVEALFHQAGVLRAETLEELIDAAALLSTQPLPRGRRPSGRFQLPDHHRRHEPGLHRDPVRRRKSPPRPGHRVELRRLGGRRVAPVGRRAEVDDDRPAAQHHRALSDRHSDAGARPHRERRDVVGGASHHVRVPVAALRARRRSPRRLELHVHLGRDDLELRRRRGRRRSAAPRARDGLERRRVAECHVQRDRAGAGVGDGRIACAREQHPPLGLGHGRRR